LDNVPGKPIPGDPAPQYRRPKLSPPGTMSVAQGSSWYGWEAIISSSVLLHQQTIG